MTACKDCKFYAGLNIRFGDRCCAKDEDVFDYYTGKPIKKTHTQIFSSLDSLKNFPLCVMKNDGNCPDFQPKEEVNEERNGSKRD